MKTNYRLIMCLIIGSTMFFKTQAQVELSWVHNFNGTLNQMDVATDMILDHDGNIIVTGLTTEHIDSTKLWFDIVTIKYNSAGDTLWTQIYNGIGSPSDGVVAMAIDNGNNVYLAGYSETNDERKLLLINYSSNGVLQWVKTLSHSSGILYAAGIVSDAENIFIAAGAGSSNDENIYLLKYSHSGDSLWTQELDIAVDASDIVNDIVLDNQGKIYLTGSIYVMGASNILTVKYNTDGDTLWTRIYDGPLGNNGFDFGHVIKVDNNNDVYVIGLSENDYGGGPEGDYILIKYDPDGNEIWTRRYDGGYGGDWPVDMVIDSINNVFITGWSISELETKSTATIKYDSLGNEKWIKRYNGIGNYFNDPSSIAIGKNGELIIATRVADTEWTNDWLIIGYSESSGDSLWSVQYDGSGNSVDIDTPSKIVVDQQNGFYVTGFTEETGNDWDITTIRYQILPTSVEDFKNTNQIAVYPNPSTGIITISGNKPADIRAIEIYNIIGEKITAVSNINRQISPVIDISDNPKGIYLIMIRIGNQIYTEKIIKQ